MGAATEHEASSRFVLDGSVALSWCFPDESSGTGEQLLASLAEGAKAIVPALWFSEVTNALIVGERRKRLTRAETTVALELLARLPVEMDNRLGHALAADVLALARKHKLTAYDATYLELAVRLRLPLATFDRKLQKAARAARLPQHAF